MIKELYFLPPDIAAYLRRLGVDPLKYSRLLHPELPPSPTAYSMPHVKESLDLLVHAHLFHVPFENLDIYDLRREPSLAIPEVFDKIVTRQRGGYCFELNALFFALLEGLGFQAYPITQRVLREGEFPPVCHRAAVVTLEETGERLLCDVGFGGPAPVGALYLDRPEVQTSGKRKFRFDTDPQRGLHRLILVEETAETPLFLFSDAPVDPVDFVPLNTYMTFNAASRFHNNRVLNLLREDGSVAIDNDVLRIHSDGQLQEIPIRSQEELKKICVEYFHMPEESLAEL